MVEHDLAGDHVEEKVTPDVSREGMLRRLQVKPVEADNRKEHNAYPVLHSVHHLRHEVCMHILHTADSLLDFL